jgi:hypothetical protein
MHCCHPAQRRGLPALVPDLTVELLCPIVKLNGLVGVAFLRVRRRDSAQRRGLPVLVPDLDANCALVPPMTLSRAMMAEAGEVERGKWRRGGLRRRQKEE